VGLADQRTDRSCNTRCSEELEKFGRRRLEEDYPYLMLDAGYEKAREDGAVRSQAVLIAIGIDWEGRRNMLAVELANREELVIRATPPGPRDYAPDGEVASWKFRRQHEASSLLRDISRNAVSGDPQSVRGFFCRMIVCTTSAGVVPGRNSFRRRTLRRITVWTRDQTAMTQCLNLGLNASKAGAGLRRTIPISNGQNFAPMAGLALPKRQLSVGFCDMRSIITTGIGCF
jgi:hypothetical protein